MRARQAGRAVEDEDPRAALVEHVGVAGGVEGDRDGVGAGSSGPARRSPRPWRSSRRGSAAATRPLTESATARMPGGVGGDAERRVELARCARPDAPKERSSAAAAVEDVDAVVAGVRDVQRAGARRRRSRAGRRAGRARCRSGPSAPCTGSADFGPKRTTRWLRSSATNTRPCGSTATPNGKLSWPRPGARAAAERRAGRARRSRRRRSGGACRRRRAAAGR